MGGVLLTVAYDGTRFSGFQYQENGMAVQNVLEEALAGLEKRFIRIKGASRTDAGVHARGQRVFFTSPLNIPDKGYLRGLNALLPGDVGVTAVHRVPETFNPRLTGGKRYEYVIRNSRIPDPMASRFEYPVYASLDEVLMREAARHILGTHDFSCFQAADCGRTETVRTIRAIEVIREGDLLRIGVSGTAFLKNMVRILAGTLLEVGRGYMAPDAVVDIITRGDRREAGPTLPARGLTLMEIWYPSLGQNPPQ